MCSRRQPVHDDARLAGPYESGSGAHAHGRAAAQEDFLESQRSVVIVRQVRAGPRSSSGLEQLLASVTSVVDLNVTRKDFSQVLQQLRPVTVLGVDQQVVRIRQGLAWPGIDRVWPEGDLGLVGWPAMPSLHREGTASSC